MNVFRVLNFKKMSFLDVVALFLMVSSPAGAVISAGGLAVVGYDDYQGTITIAALEPIAGDQTVYFTNNGWSSSRNMFNGADPAQGAGSETLLKLIITGPIAKGTVFSSTAGGATYSWDKSSVIPGTTNGVAQFSDLLLDYNSDQIYAFQGPDSNPLLSPSNFIYALHFGNGDYPTFSDAVDTMSGAIPPGLSLDDHTAMAMGGLSAHGTADGDHSSWGLNMDSPLLEALQDSTAHKDQWLSVIGDSSNWTSSPTVAIHLAVAPEPTRVCLFGFAGVVFLLRRERRKI